MRRFLTSTILIGSMGVAVNTANSSTSRLVSFTARVVKPKKIGSGYPNCPPCRTMATTMKAVRVNQFGDENQLKVVSMDIPTPNPNEVLVKVEAVGLNPVETMIRKGWFGDMVTPPYVPGTDVAGTIEEVGHKVTKYKKGDRVYAIKTTSGAYAQYCTAPVDYISPLTRRLSFEQGAALGVPYTAAYKALFLRAKPKRGDTILVHGASGVVGLAAVQMAKSKGFRVIGTSGTVEGMELIKANGADFVFNHRTLGYRDKIMEATKGRGVNVILEMMADKNLVKDLSIVAPRSRIVMIGFQGSIPEFNPGLAMGVEASIMGVAVQTSTEEEYQEMLDAINQGQRSWVNPHIAKEYRLDEVAQAHVQLEDGSGAPGKRVLKPHLKE